MTTSGSVSMLSKLVVSPVPELWTFVEIHERASSHRRLGDTRALRADTVDAWRQIAKAVIETVEALEADRLSPDELFAEAVWNLSGKRFEELLKEKLHLEDESSFDAKRIAPLRRHYEFDDVDAHEDARRVRLLLMHAGEVRFVPFAEGALAGIAHSPSRVRWDIRTGFHVVTRWASTHEPVLAALVALSLVVRGEPRAWRPFTVFYQRVLANHVVDDARRDRAAHELSRLTSHALHTSVTTPAEHGETLRYLMTQAEELGLLPPRPRFEREESARQESELTRLLLDLELGRGVGDGAARLIELIHAETGVGGTKS